MPGLRDQYLSAARTGLDLLAEGAVAGTWHADSALEGFTVGGLAAHFASQITSIAGSLEADYTDKDVIGLFGHYDRAAWLAADIDNDYNTAIRTGGQAAVVRALARAERAPSSVSGL